MEDPPPLEPEQGVLSPSAYLKMIDYFLMYSFNIINVVMVYYTYQATHVEEQFAPNEDDKAMEV